MDNTIRVVRSLKKFGSLQTSFKFIKVIKFVYGALGLKSLGPHTLIILEKDWKFSKFTRCEVRKLIWKHSFNKMRGRGL